MKSFTATVKLFSKGINIYETWKEKKNDSGCQLCDHIASCSFRSILTQP